MSLFNITKETAEALSDLAFMRIILPKRMKKIKKAKKLIDSLPDEYKLDFLKNYSDLMKLVIGDVIDETSIGVFDNVEKGINKLYPEAKLKLKEYPYENRKACILVELDMKDLKRKKELEMSIWEYSDTNEPISISSELWKK